MTVIRISLFAFFCKRFADQLNVEYKDLNTNKTYPKGQPDLLHYIKVNINEGWLVKQNFKKNLSSLTEIGLNALSELQASAELHRLSISFYLYLQASTSFMYYWLIVF